MLVSLCLAFNEYLMKLQSSANLAIEGVKIRQNLFNLKENEGESRICCSSFKGAIWGTVIGDGKIKFVLARVDTRVFYGQ